MHIKDAVVLISGANRGIGLAFAQGALARGARKVYAAVRNPDDILLPGVEACRLDVRSDAEVAELAARCQDVTLVVNNAGIARPGPLLVADSLEILRSHLETNLFGVLRMMQAFAPILAAHGGGAFLNVLSVASWINTGALTGYGISKAAAWSLTNGLRNELRAQNTQVLALHMGFVDTDMTRGFEVAKVSPQSIVDEAFAALEAGASEVTADERSRQIKRGLTADPAVYL